jgi:hypothetical protein
MELEDTTGLLPADARATDLLEPQRQESAAFIGRWNRLISQTNWEKGAIIVQWRLESGTAISVEPEALADPSALPPWNTGSSVVLAEGTQRSDELWSRLVGGVSPQHVGRLRRTWERFGASQQTFPGLFWSHFYAALDWDDAEMWLEGAVREGWSVSKMRTRRWETLGGDPAAAPDPAGRDLVISEIMEENQSLATSESPVVARDFSSEPLDEGPDFGPAEMELGSSDYPAGSIDIAANGAGPGEALFGGLAGLPPDVADAVEAMQLCIIRHRSAGWQEISVDRMKELLGALQRLASSHGDAHGLN